MTDSLRRRSMILVGAVGVFVVSVPSVVLACPVCFSAQNEENRAAFVMMTVFLTLLPLGMLGLGLGWAWRRLRAQDGRAAEARPLDASSPTPDTSTS